MESLNVLSIKVEEPVVFLTLPLIVGSRSTVPIRWQSREMSQQALLHNHCAINVHHRVVKLQHQYGMVDVETEVVGKMIILSLWILWTVTIIVSQNHGALIFSTEPMTNIAGTSLQDALGHHHQVYNIICHLISILQRSLNGLSSKSWTAVAVDWPWKLKEWLVFR